jgi:PAS domain S-box-containing protein
VGIGIVCVAVLLIGLWQTEDVALQACGLKKETLVAYITAIVAMSGLLLTAALERQIRARTAELKTAHEKTSSILSAAPASLRFIKVSKEQARALGLASPADAIGKTVSDLIPGAPSQRVVASEREILRTGLPLFAQVEKTSDGSGRNHWDSVSKAPIQNADGALIGIVGIARDITPEIELQQQLQQVMKMEAIGRLAGVSEKDSQHDDLRQIERFAKRAAGLTRQLLTFSRKQRIELQAVDLNQLIQSAENMLKRMIGENGIDLAIDLRRRQPHLPVLLCSGYTGDSVRWDFIQQEGFHFLAKPYPVAKLLASVRDTLADTPNIHKETTP